MAHGDRIRAGRQARGLGLKTLAADLGIKESELNGIEKNLRHPDDDLIAKIVARLEISDFLLQMDAPLVGMGPASDRLESLEEALRPVVLAQASLWMERNMIVEGMYPDEMHIPTYPEGFPVSLPEDHKAAVASDAAEALRRAWMLGSAAPAPFLADLLEGIGIRVGFIPGVLTFDAAAFIAVDGETSIPCIVAQSTMAQGDLQRFAIARELAFLLLEDVSRAEANHFAGALLLPEAALVEDFGGQRHNIEMMELYMTKQKYGISIRHILSRLASLRIISGDLYKELLDFYNDAGWNDVEPGMQVPPEQPYRLYRRVMRGQLDGDITLGTGAALAGLTLPDWMNFLSIGELAAAISPR